MGLAMLAAVEISGEIGAKLINEGGTTAPVRGVSFARALRLGTQATVSLWPAVVATFLADWGGRLAVLLAFGAFWALARVEGLRAAALAASGLGVVWLLAQLLRALALGAGIRQGCQRMRGLEVEGLVSAVLRSSGVAWSWLLWSAVIELAVSIWQAAALFLTGSAFGMELVSGHRPLLAAAGFSWALTLVLPVGVAFALWVEVAFSRAIASETGYLASLWDTAAILWERPWSAFGLWALTALATFGLVLFVSAMAPRGFGTRGSTFIWVGAAFVAAGLQAFIRAVLELVRFEGFAALELGRVGRLPEALPGKGEVLALAEPVVEALPVPEPPPSLEAAPPPVPPSLSAEAVARYIEDERRRASALLRCSGIELDEGPAPDLSTLGEVACAAWRWTSRTGDLEVEVHLARPDLPAARLFEALEAAGRAAHQNGKLAYRVHALASNQDATTPSRISELLSALAGKE